MAKSSITQHTGVEESAFRVALGRAIRRERVARGLSQAALGRPFTRSFVSGVERGRYLPSLRALYLIASRLEVRVGALLPEVNAAEAPRILVRDARDYEATDRRR